MEQIPAHVGAGPLRAAAGCDSGALADSAVSRVADGVSSWASERYRVLVVDDDTVDRRHAKRVLGQVGYEIWSAASGSEALALLAQRGTPHVALVDLLMPDMDGLELCRRLHQTSELPTIVLTGVHDRETASEALEAYAEDYITKPFSPSELVARVERLLRRIRSFDYTDEPRVRLDDRLEVDLAQSRILVDGLPIVLTPLEHRLLGLLLANAGRTLSSRYLVRRMWPLEEVPQEVLRTHICRLRRKLERDPANPRYLLTRRGLGYFFVREP